MPRKRLRPPIKLRRKYQALIELCKNTILTAPSQTSNTEGGKELYISILIAWPTKIGTNKRIMVDYADGLPRGVVVKMEDGKALVRHSCVKLLQHFKDRGYISYTAADLFAMRLPTLMRLAKLELGLERSMERLDVDLQQFDSEDNE